MTDEEQQDELEEMDEEINDLEASIDAKQDEYDELGAQIEEARDDLAELREKREIRESEFLNKGYTE